MSTARRLYTAALWGLAPLALGRLWLRGTRMPAYRERVGERLGRTPPRTGPPAVWVHAVSVGEVQAALPLIERLRRELPGLPLVVTTVTPTGSERVRERLGSAVHHCYLPYDLPASVGRFLDRVRPAVGVIMETELWPNLYAACEARGVPVVVANARLSPRSWRGYRRLGRLARETLRRVTVVAAQSEADAERFRALGAHPERVHVTGSLKFDLATPASLVESGEALRRVWGPNRPVWVAGSTHEGEEEAALAAHRTLLERWPEALLVLVPRRPERFERVAALVRRAGFRLARRSAGAWDERAQVLLGDTMGELRLFYAAADAAFVGGSLVPHGGHNPLEAAALGRPVAYGPHTFNFDEIARLLVEEGAARRVGDAGELAATLAGWLADAAARTAAGERGRLAVARNRGALDRLWTLLAPLLPRAQPSG